MSYELLPEHPQGSPLWHKGREGGLGASETAAVLGLSPWQTPLGVWRTKQGIPNDIDPDAAYWGHKHEASIRDWLNDSRPELGGVGPGISVRSIEHPWLTATPDGMTTDGRPCEFKTAETFAAAHWPTDADGNPRAPDMYVIQAVQQAGILGADGTHFAALIGSRSPFYQWIPFDPVVYEQIVRITGGWWQRHIVEGVMPDPVSLAEQNELWPSREGSEAELSEQAFEVFERRNVLLSDIKAQKAEADALQLALGDYVKDAETLTYQGRKVATYKTQQGKAGIDTKRLKAEHPDIYEALSTRGAPFKVLRTVKERTND